MSRRRFLAGALPLLGSVPLAKDLAGSRGEQAGLMERGEHSPGAHAGADAERVIAAHGEKSLSVLVPPRPKPHRPGRVREYELEARETRMELMRGVSYDAWAYNGTVPGPILRATHADVLRVMFTNRTPHAHSIHLHGTHPPDMDGSLEPVRPGSSYIYETVAEPWGFHLYHCHTRPLASHISKGLYGAFIVDPPEPRRKAQELVLMMSGFDTNGDGRNELYAFNGRPFQYDARPIQVNKRYPVRVYLANVTEHESVASFHLHAAMFRLYRTGTTRDYEYTDTVTLAQGERAILEIDFAHRGLYMFHAHQSRLTDNGLSGWFQVVDGTEQQVAGAAGALYGDEFSDCTPCLGDIGAKALLKY